MSFIIASDHGTTPDAPRIMEGAIDLRLVVSNAGILISLGGEMAGTKQSLKVQAEFIRDLEGRLRH